MQPSAYVSIIPILGIAASVATIHKSPFAGLRLLANKEDLQGSSQEALKKVSPARARKSVIDGVY